LNPLSKNNEIRVLSPGGFFPLSESLNESSLKIKLVSNTAEEWSNDWHIYNLKKNTSIR
jgi:hypothetical protein